MSKKSVIADFLAMDEDIRSYRESPLLADSDCLVGLEIELEGVNLSEKCKDDIAFRYWSLHDEDSIKGAGAYEFVFNQPFAGADVVTAINHLCDLLGGTKPSPIISVRTSTHVHLDVRNLSYEQLYRFLLMYVVTERLLYRYCGAKRMSNPFCVQIDSSNVKIRSDVDDFILNLPDNHARYLGLNMNAIKKFGSVEFRMLGGAWKADKILNWTNILLSLRKYAISNEIDLDELPCKISTLGCEEYMATIFGDYAKSLYTEHSRTDLLRGTRRAQDIIFYKDLYDNLADVIELANNAKQPKENYYENTLTKLGQKYDVKFMK